MAKRFNIIRNIKEEIKKGNTYVAQNGNFVSADLLNNEILTQFKRDLSTNPEKIAAIPYDQYKTQALSGYTTATEVLDGICEAFNLVNDDPANAEEAAPEQTIPDLHEPETSEEVANESEHKTRKRPTAKAGDAK